MTSDSRDLPATDQHGRIREALRAFQAKSHFVVITIYRVEGDECVRVAAEGAACRECNRVPLSVGNIGLVARSGKTHVARDVTTDPLYKSCFTGVKSEVVLPVIVNGETVGVVDAEAAEGVCINVDELADFAEHVAVFF
jgi:putative methionine-R-sulfoxide reductase with GAF domain